MSSTLYNAMDALKHKMMAERGLAETSAQAYIRHLVDMNDGPFRTLSFLHDVKAVVEKLAEKSLSVRRTHYAAAHAALSTQKSPKAVSLTARYKTLLTDNGTAIAAAAPAEGEMTEKEKAKWMNWPDIIKRRNELAKSINAYSKWSEVVPYLLLCLYTKIEPRRNKDWMKMKLAKYKGDMDLTKADNNYNYYDMPKKRFIFNNYKTAKRYGQQIIAVPESLDNDIMLALASHPYGLDFLKSDADVAMLTLLVGSDGKEVSDGFILKALKAALGKPIGSSMLRHIYLSHKYGATVGAVLKETTASAKAMGHSITEQRRYLRAAAAGAGSDNITHE
jgi:hypothetical protein